MQSRPDAQRPTTKRTIKNPELRTPPGAASVTPTDSRQTS